MFSMLLLSAAHANPCELGACLTTAPEDEAPAIEMPRPKADPHGKAMKLAGIGVTANGAVIAAAGGTLALAGLVSGSNCTDEHGHCGMGPAFAIVYGTGIAISSVPFLATGIPLWIAGQHRINKRRKGAQAAMDVRVTPRFDRPGLVVSGRW